MELEILYGKVEKGNAIKHTVYINGILNFLLMRNEEGLRSNPLFGSLWQILMFASKFIMYYSW